MSSPPPLASPAPLSWTDWPARRTPVRAAAVGLIIALVGLLAAQMDPYAGLVSTLLLIVSTGEVMLPSTFLLDQEGVSVRRMLGNRSLRWDELSGWRAAPDGFVLQRPQVSRWRRSRAPLLLRCPGREEDVRSWLTSAPGPRELAA